MPEKVTYITYGKESFDINEFYREKPIKPSSNETINWIMG